MNLRSVFALGALAASLAVPSIASAQTYYPQPNWAQPVYRPAPVYAPYVTPYQPAPVYQTAPVQGVPVYGGYNPYQGPVPMERGGWDRGREGGWDHDRGREGGWDRGREGGWDHDRGGWDHGGWRR